MSNSYEKAGVNLEAGYESVRRIKSHVARTAIAGAWDSLGAFGGMFDLSTLGLKEPVLVSGTDGVGTKLMLAFALNRHDTIGIDAVAMCVNDIIVQGAKPLFFLDYLAVGKNNPMQIEDIVKGVADGCVQAGCALIGGETAEMPGMYAEGHYDIAGFALGAVEKAQIITGQTITEGDVLIGLPSSGVHSNGFSLVRKIIADKKLDLNSAYSGLTASLGESLMAPTRIYVKTVLESLGHFTVKGMAHITGGGFYENLPRTLPRGLGLKVDAKAIAPLPVFSFLQEQGGIPQREMYNVFNMGIGYAFIVPKKEADKALGALVGLGEEPKLLGSVVFKEGVDISW